ncbi:transcriptional regulator [Bradyrhizobium sp. Y36]|uniref:winged helix-turn-helix transcriptional regulator n=1 Tax=Bradyrhizobium sp. Y36 TaxID=2035447 RepID=UPI000BE7CA74|nr:helix-turn-helix domain-containing protein [Bradyrhizobium sp. Y36]PDT91941.1 transcriptional regulator [Bradyrhizobium sp. Y36]
MAKQADSKTRSVRGSRTGRPIMVLLDLLGRRWSLRILWELRDEPLTSRALRTACDDASPTVLQARLTELREAGFVELEEGGGYGLTPLGRDLCEMVMPLHRFAERWQGSSPSPRLQGEGRGKGEPPRRR